MKSKEVESFILESKSRYMNIQIECIVAFSQMKEAREIGIDNITFLTSASKFKVLLEEVKFLRRHLRKIIGSEEVEKIDIIKDEMK